MSSYGTKLLFFSFANRKHFLDTSNLAYYIITPAAAATLRIDNRAVATASSPGNSNNVSDTSDDGDDTDGNTTDDPTVVETFPKAFVEVTKTAAVSQNDGNSNNNTGDVITYTIVISNTGSVTLSNLNLVDTLTDGNGQLLTLTTTPTFVSATTSSTSTTLQVSGVSTYTATYQVNQQAVDSGQINNTVLVTASSPGQTNNVTDRSDDGDDSDGNTTNDSTVISITATPSFVSNR